ncbi:carbon-phosphorus lyase complex subunit PhnI [Bradyrhizobium sp. SSUT77]|uniref:carbon-phosphorus lyase complex subunit PhnI n=1 Tax=Bradyrhizobium sp. SSUT77 TaxID=3040603 RepID=UPI002447CDB5|nr:carbon-phosphorus lyase complex subunit PhnI [Bradyrhizobium sp. SSUT77]MDH2347770.1 carbon-phosphorus lyase complex subunit PhnI [Bradyrhizobium sp. SSUT77]
MYFKIRGGERAIAASQNLLAVKRRGDPAVPELAIEQIMEQMALAVDRVMMEGALYDRTLAAVAIKQAQGDLVEACFLVRAARATLERFGVSEPVNPARMTVRRRISTTHKDVPGGQILGPTYDYTHRLVDFGLHSTTNSMEELEEAAVPGDASEALSRDLASLTEAELIEVEAGPVDEELASDERGASLQALARGDEGFLLGLAYSSMRGHGDTEPLAGEIRFGELVVEMRIPELGITVGIGEISVTECQTLHPFMGSEQKAPQFSRGYGLVFGQSERKAISMAVIDRALRAEEFGEEEKHPIQDREFVVSHADNVKASGFVQVLKLPHYVHFQGRLQLLRELRSDFETKHCKAGKREKS